MENSGHISGSMPGPQADILHSQVPKTSAPLENLNPLDNLSDIQNPNPSLHNPTQEQRTPVPEENKHEGNLLVDLVTNPTYRNTSIAAVNALFHGLSAFSLFNPENANGQKTAFADFCDKTAFFFTRWVAPLSSYAVAAVESIGDKKWIEALVKAIPPLFLPFVGEANIDAVYGSSTGFNCPYDMVIGRLDKKAEQSKEFKEQYTEASKSGMGHAKLFISEFKNMASDFVKGKLEFTDNALLASCAAIITGSLPMMLFMRNDRDSWAARLLGLIRNAGGIGGDTMYTVQGMKNPKERYKAVIGVFCTLAAVSDVVKRWVTDSAAAKVLIHLGAALNVSGYAVWNAFSGTKKKESENGNIESALAAPVPSHGMSELQNGPEITKKENISDLENISVDSENLATAA